MGCNCKNSNNFEQTEETNNKNILENVLKYFFKSLGFIVSLILLPIIIGAVIWFLFDVIVLNKNVDLGRIVKLVAKNIKKFNEDSDEYDDDEEDDDDEFEELNEEDYIALNVEDITDKTK